MNFDKTYFLALFGQEVDSLLDGLTDRTHSNDDMFCVRCAVIIEQTVVCTDFSVYFIHILFYDCRKSIIILIASFSSLEEDIRVLCGAHLSCMIWIQGILTEFHDGIHICHIFQIFIIPNFYFLYFMRGTETIKEVDKSYFTFNRCQMCNRGNIHYFLYAGRYQHCATCLAASIHVRVITKDVQCMASNCSCCYVEYTRKGFTGYFIQVRNHQQKTLRCSIGSCKRTCCERTMYSTSCTGF